MKQTNSLQKSYDPFANGRWYRLFLESDGKYKITESDINALLSDNYISVDNINILTSIVKPHFTSIDTSSKPYNTLYTSTGKIGRMRLLLPIPSTVDYCEVFIFGEKK